MNTKITDDTKITSLRNMALNLLKTIEVHKYKLGEHERDIYFVNKETFDQFVTLDATADAIVGKKSALGDIFSIRSVKPILRYAKEMKMQIKSNTITSQEKIKAALLPKFSLFVLDEKNRLEEHLSNNTSIYSQSEKQEKREALLRDLEEKEKKVNEIYDSFEKYKMHMSTYKEEAYYCYLYCNFYEPVAVSNATKAKYVFLRQNVANIFYYAPIENDDTELRIGAKVKDMVKHGNNLFGDFYYKIVK